MDRFMVTITNGKTNTPCMACPARRAPKRTGANAASRAWFHVAIPWRNVSPTAARHQCRRCRQQKTIPCKRMLIDIADHEVSHCLHVMTLRLHVHIRRCRLHSGLDPEESLVKTPATDPGQNLFIGDGATASTEYGGGSNVLVHRTARRCFEGLASESCRYQGLPQWGWTSAES